MKPLPTAERLRELFEYDPLTGVLRWRVSPSHSVKAGDVAGCLYSDGYRNVGIGGRYYGVHRVIWCMQTGDWPVIQIDHWDLDQSNNRWLNLRPATHAQNQQNRSGFGALGVKGVRRLRGGKFEASIMVDGVRTYLGSCYETCLSASTAYSRAAFTFHGEFARTK